MTKLISRAKRIRSYDKNVCQYRKAGNFETAVEDFRSLRPVSLIEASYSLQHKAVYVMLICLRGRRRGLVVKSRTPEREVGGSILTRVAVLYPRAKYIYLPKRTGNNQEAVAPSQHD